MICECLHAYTVREGQGGVREGKRMYRGRGQRGAREGWRGKGRRRNGFQWEPELHSILLLFLLLGIEGRKKASRTPSATDDGYADVFDAVKPSFNTLQPSPLTKRHTPTTTSKPLQTLPLPTSTSPDLTSPTSPDMTVPAHKKMFIRGGSESSGPDNIVISLKPDGEGEAEEGGATTPARATPTNTTPPSPMSPNSDEAALSPQSSGSGVVEMARTGSAGSTSSSHGGSLNRPKPPTKPKPTRLRTSTGSTGSPTHSSSESTPSRQAHTVIGSSSTFPHKTVTKNQVPPKPARSGAQTARRPPPATPTREDVVPTENGNVATVSPSHVAPPLTNGSSEDGGTSSRPLSQGESSDPAPNGSATFPKPPPKPARKGTTKQRQSKSESESDREKSPLAPISTNTTNSDLPSSGAPPPKPARRGKSVKIVDPSTSTEETTGSKTLPHHFKAPQQDEEQEKQHQLTPDSSPTLTSRSSPSSSPKPTPKPRAAARTTGGRQTSARTDNMEAVAAK